MSFQSQPKQHDKDHCHDETSSYLLDRQRLQELNDLAQFANIIILVLHQMSTEKAISASINAICHPIYSNAVSSLPLTLSWMALKHTRVSILSTDPQTMCSSHDLLCLEALMPTISTVTLVGWVPMVSHIY